MSIMAPDLTTSARAAARSLAAIPTAQRDAALEAIARAIEERADEIAAANRIDVEAAEGKRSSAIVDRLTLTPERIAELAHGVRAVAALPDPTGVVLDRFEREDGLLIEKTSVPLGVIAVIYEARPNVTTDAAALTIKSGNACILRGSRMAGPHQPGARRPGAHGDRRDRPAGRRRAGDGHRPRGAARVHRRRPARPTS